MEQKTEGSNNHSHTSSPEGQVTQSLEDIFEDLRKKISELPPPKSSRADIMSAWEFLRGIRQDDILRFVSVINQLSSDDIQKKAEEIEQLAHRLDTAQKQEYETGERMNIMQR